MAALQLHLAALKQGGEEAVSRHKVSDRRGCGGSLSQITSCVFPSLRLGCSAAMRDAQQTPGQGEVPSARWANAQIHPSSGSPAAAAFDWIGFFSQLFLFFPSSLPSTPPRRCRRALHRQARTLRQRRRLCGRLDVPALQEEADEGGVARSRLQSGARPVLSGELARRPAVFPAGFLAGSLRTPSLTELLLKIWNGTHHGLHKSFEKYRL